jgi:hypothetical protein
MPRDRARRNAWRTPLDRSLRAEARAAQRAELGPLGRLKKRVGWPVCALGLGLFAITFVASSAGVVLVPFDPHHVLGQVIGGVLAFTGLLWATS